jgi:hypothetical protein
VVDWAFVLFEFSGGFDNKIRSSLGFTLAFADECLHSNLVVGERLGFNGCRIGHELVPVR